MTLIFLLIEFFDELHYAIGGAVLPAMRADLALSYAQVGLLLGLPHVIGTLIEPFIMLLGDTGLRKRLIVGGGVAIVFSLILTASAPSFPVLMLAFVIGFPASGAFVTLSQATLMHLNPSREPQMMARWTLAGSLGNLLGPLIVAGGFALAFGWRWVFVALTVVVLALLLAVLSRRFPLVHRPQPHSTTISGMVREIWQNLGEAIRNLILLRWIVLLQLSDLLLDILTGYVPLYLTDVIGVTPTQAGLLLSVLMLASLASDFVLIPILERVPGRAVVRLSAAISIPMFAALLLAPWPAVKIVLLIVLRFSTIGWYSVLQGEAYASVPGRGGTVMAVSSLAGLLGGGLTWLVGWIASHAGLPTAMWLLILGPLSLAFFVPRPSGSQPQE